jgi:transposase
MVITRKERERLVLELYNQGKTIREIAKEVRMSFRDIGAILNKALEEKKSEGSKEEQDNIESEKNQERLSLSTQAYKLFSNRMTPLEVAIELNLSESEATKFYREYWKLRQLHNLNMVYEELRGDIEPFLTLYKLAKRKGIGPKQVVNLLTIANNDLPELEERLKTLRNDMSTLQFQKRIDERNLYQLNNQIATTTKLLNSFRISCIRERREVEKLYNEKAMLEALVTGFKNNNEDYLKIKQTAEEKVKDVLTNSKLILKFATLSVIESLRRNPELYNFISYSTSVVTASTTYGSNSYLPLMSGRQHQQQSFNDSYTALILEESEKLYNTLKTELTNSVITTAAAIRESSLPLPIHNSRQKLTYENDDTYQTEGSRYNNQPEI